MYINVYDGEQNLIARGAIKPRTLQGEGASNDESAARGLGEAEETSKA